MLKNIIFFIEFILFIIIAIFISLLFGLTVSNLSYENLTISKLYLKYDKNLIVKMDNFIIHERNTSKTHKFRLDAQINIIDKKYFLDIKELKYYTHDLTLKAKLNLSKEKMNDILDFKIDNLELKDFSFKFDKLVKPVLTSKTFITYKNDNVYFKLENPSVNNISLPKSKVLLKNVTKDMLLYLELKSNDKINNKLINIIAHYGLKLPLKQYYGSNKIDVKVEIPFRNKNVKIYVNVKSKNTKILFDKKLIHAKDLSVIFKNGILYIKSKNGDINIAKKDIKFKNMSLVYKDNIFDIKASSGKIHILDRDITFNNLKAKYNVNKNHLNLSSSHGKTLFNKKDVVYDKLKFDMLNDNIKINIEKGLVDIYDDSKFEKANITLKNDILKFNTKVYAKDFNASIKNTTDINNDSSSGELKINKLSFNHKIKIKNKSLFYTLKHKGETIDLKIPAHKIDYLYDGKTTHIVNINKFSSIFSSLNFLEIKDNKVKVKILSKNNFETSYININGVDININAKKFKLFNEIKNPKKENDIEYPKSNILIKNSSIAYDKRYIHIKNANIDMNKNKASIDIDVKDEKSNIKVDLINKNYEIVAKNMSSKFVNRILKKSRFKSGSFNFDGYGSNKYFNGTIGAEKTTVKNMVLINNLITFINTTPAFYNPLLALPTLFRLGEVGFNVTRGYYIKNSKAEFSYNFKKDILDIDKFYTNGKISDFKGVAKIDFKKETIKSVVDVSFLKDFSKVIKNIPVLGYIIVGEDGNFITKINIDGNFDKQSFETNMINDTAEGIFNVIKRTISLPLLPVVESEEEKEE